MTDYIRRMDEAAKEVKEAKKVLSMAEKQRRNDLKQLQKNVKACEDHISKAKQEYAGIKRYLDHLEYNGRSYVLNENTFAEVITSGEITSTITSKSTNGISLPGALIGGAVAGSLGAVVGGVKHNQVIESEENDHRRHYLHVRCDDGEFTAETKPDEETKTRQFADEINNAGRNAEDAIQSAQANLDFAKNRLRDAEADFTAINNAQYALEEKERAYRLVEAAGTGAEKEMLAERNRKRRKNMIIAAVAAVLLLALFARPKKKEPQNHEEPIAAVTPEPSPSATPEPTPAASGIRPEFKESMDAYEAFFDEYVEFMKSVDETSMSMESMVKYYDFLAKYEDAMEALDAIDETELTDEEDRYYLDVLLRIDQKLLEAAQ